MGAGSPTTLKIKIFQKECLTRKSGLPDLKQGWRRFGTSFAEADRPQ